MSNEVVALKTREDYGRKELLVLQSTKLIYVCCLFNCTKLLNF